MNESVMDLMKIIFLLGFTIHNLEEAIWLPKWSKHARKFHEPVEADEFIFAVIVVTIIGTVLTALDILIGNPGSLVNYVYLGFIGMMCLNVFFPHLAATVVLKRYAPGLITAVLLNLPFSLIIIIGHIKNGIHILYLIIAVVVVGGLILVSLKPLFKLGRALIDFSD
jgi:hypothetical protein